MVLKDLKEHLELTGWSGVIASYLYQLFNRVFYFDYLCLMTLEIGAANPTFFGPISGYQEGFLSEADVRSFAKDPDYLLSDDYVSLALQNGDVCYGVAQGGTLAAYAWYSQQPSKVTADFKVHFPDDFIYTHHGYTNPSFRGQRLHAFGMTHALQHYTGSRHKGLMAIVAGENIASLKSTKRMGYQIVGHIYLFALLGRYLVFHDRDTRHMGVWLSPMRPNLKSYRFGMDKKLFRDV